MGTTNLFPTTRSRVVSTDSVERTLVQVIKDFVAGTQELECTYTEHAHTMTLHIDRPGLLATLSVSEQSPVVREVLPSLFDQKGGVL